MAAVLCIDDIDQYRLGNLVKGVDLTRFQASALYTLGAVAFGKNGKEYRYVRFVDAVPYVAGHVVMLASATQWDVTNDMSGGSALAGLWPAGVCIGVPTQNQYGWIQTKGIATFLAGSAAIIAGDPLKPDGTTDGASDEATAGTDENIMGVALATVADTATGLCMLHIRI